MKKSGQVLNDIRHGGHVLENRTPAAIDLARTQETISLAPAEVTFETPFDFLFPQLASDADALLPASNPSAVVAGLKSLGNAMVEEQASPQQPLQATGNSSIPAIYTYWGQFLDHDLTANTDRNTQISDITIPNLAPLSPAFVTANLKNLRQPTINIDSVYGDGPTFDASNPTQAGPFYEGIKFKIGTAARETERIDGDPEPIGGARIPPDDDLQRDLPRLDKVAQIADARNDENLIIAQFHLAFLRFHNAVVDWIAANEPDDCGTTPERLFERARQLTRWHHQWLVLHDFLPTITMHGIADKVMIGGAKHYNPTGAPFMPLEFSVACYRFGHSMVRAAYDYNRNFGRGDAPLIPNAPFNLLFAFTGEGFPSPFLGQTDRLPFNWIIEWDRLIDKGSSTPDHFARKIDTLLAPPLDDMVNQGNDEPDIDIKAILKSLATRNLLRGYLLSIPTGQSVANAMGVAPLSASELQSGNTPALNQVLSDNGFLERTPLWYYVLKEAEVRANGNSLGEVGSRVVCETIIGQLRHDAESFLNQNPVWTPAQGVKLPNGDPIVTIADFIRFAGIPA